MLISSAIKWIYRPAVYEPQEPLFSFLICTVSALTLTVYNQQYNLMPNILVITMSLYNHTENTDLLAVKKENRIEFLAVLPVCISAVLLTRSDAICQYALSATLVTGHLLPGVLFEGPRTVRLQRLSWLSTHGPH